SALLLLEDFYRSRVAGIVIYQLQEKRFQIRSDGQTRPRRKSGQFRSDPQHELENLAGHAGSRRYDMGKVQVLKKERSQVFDAIAAAITTNQVGIEQQSH